MGLGKKGILFTFLAILLSALFVLLYSARIDAPLDQNNDLISARVQRLTMLSEDIDRYLGDALEASTVSALTSMTAHLGETHIPIPANDLQPVFLACAKKAEPYCMDLGTPRLEDYWADYADTLDDLGIISSFSITTISIDQTYPFDLNVVLNATIYLEDPGYATISHQTYITRTVSIQDLPDPSYHLHAQFNFTQNATIRPYPRLYDINWTRENLTEFINDTLYRYSNDAPSYLKRFENTNTPSPCCGIESMINPNTLRHPYAPYFRNMSYIDWKMWEQAASGSPIYSSIYCIKGISSVTPPTEPPFPEFRLDVDALSTYNVPGLDWVNAPVGQACPPQP